MRERLWGLRALALTRSGRQADALEVLRQVRELLAEELGLEPGAELRDAADRRAAPGPRRSSGRRAATVPQPAAAGGSRAAGEFAWPLVGRDDQLAALVGLLEQSADAAGLRRR